MARRRLLVALALSLLIHATVAVGPAWRLPVEDDEAATAALEAHLVPPRRAAPAPVAQKPRRVEPARAPAPVAAPAPAGEAEAPRAREEAPVALASPPPAPVPAVQPEVRAEIAWPRQGRILFLVTRGEGEQGMQLGQSEHSWQHDGSAYALRAVTETTGLAALFRPVKVVQVSEGAIGADGLAPREFRVERNGQAAEGARFDREAMRVALLQGGAVRRELTLAQSAQDLLSQVYQVGQIGAAARLELMIATGKNYGRYAFEAVGEERISTPWGELRTWHVRTPAMPGEQATELWLASDHRNLPVRIRFVDRKGDVYDQTAVEMEIDGARLARREP